MSSPQSPHPGYSQPFELRVSRNEVGPAVIFVTGELDLSTGLELKDRVFSELERRPTAVILELSRCGYIDSVGLSMFLVARKRADRVGSRIALAGMNRLVGLVFTTSGTSDLFDSYPSLDDALAAV